MSLNLIITERSKLSQALLNIIRSDENAEGLKIVKRMEDLARLIYVALPNKDKNKAQHYTQRMNCNISWYANDKKLTVSFLLFLDALTFGPVPDGMRLETVEGDWEISWLITLLEDAVKHYLTEDASSFKKVIPKYGMKESIAESKLKKKSA